LERGSETFFLRLFKPSENFPLENGLFPEGEGGGGGVESSRVMVGGLIIGENICRLRGEMLGCRRRVKDHINA
jgi:hypothetical protein